MCSKLCLCQFLSNCTHTFLECAKEFSFLSAEKRRDVFLVQTSQVIFSTAYKFLSDTTNGFLTEINGFFCNLERYVGTS